MADTRNPLLNSRNKPSEEKENLRESDSQEKGCVRNRDVRSKSADDSFSALALLDGGLSVEEWRDRLSSDENTASDSKQVADEKYSTFAPGVGF